MELLGATLRKSYPRMPNVHKPLLGKCGTYAKVVEYMPHFESAIYVGHGLRRVDCVADFTSFRGLCIARR